MNEFWMNLTRQDLKDMEPPDLPYPGAQGIRSRLRRKLRPRRRVAFRLAVAAAAVAALSLSVWAGYERWHMPEVGETYKGDSIQVHRENSYTLDPSSGGYQAEQTQATQPQEPEALPDSWFLDQAVQAMELVNKTDVDRSRLTVTRQTDQRWGREEVEVGFPEDEDPRDVTFDAESGYLIGITAFDTGRSGGEPMDEAAALAVAQGYYDALPYARGYEFRSVEKFDDESWMYSFDRPIQVELWGETLTLYSAYEEVRITIDPCTGAFQDSNCFYVPLLDDHQPGDEPLTEAQAREIADGLEIFAQDMENYTVTAQLTVCLPSPIFQPFQEGENVNYRYSDVTRLGWSFQYEGEIDGFANSYWVSVDLYTGEVLSIDATG